MSDDEDLAPAVKKQRIHFGSLETVERERLVTGSSNDNDDDRKDDDDQEAEGEDNEVSAAVLAGIRAGNINISEGKLVIIILQLKVLMDLMLVFIAVIIVISLLVLEILLLKDGLISTSSLHKMVL